MSKPVLGVPASADSDLVITARRSADVTRDAGRCVKNLLGRNGELDFLHGDDPGRLCIVDELS